ncbi:ABC transporter permease [Rhodospirillaceae bacterium]|jgi:peptide/nickel transport system permease protein|nr:ABC transporter permease [Rhodospirillaceae bacterium]|tara:strand:+ start:5217 stop:6134 length:918 start_codon:yes stop_codon:yes gene_type:complete
MLSQTAKKQKYAFWSRFFTNQTAVLSLCFLVVMVLAILASPIYEYLRGIDPNRVDLFNRFLGPSRINFLGTDELGRDLMLRLLNGGKVSLSIGLISSVISSLIGTAMGLTAGYFGGKVDAIIMRFADTMISLPLLPLLIVLTAIDLNKLGLSQTYIEMPLFSSFKIIIIIAIVGWPSIARLVRASTLAVRENDYIQVALSQGFSPSRIMSRHILPNVTSPIIVATTLTVGNIILFESVLSFLGLGIQPPTASWGNMLTGAQDLIYEDPKLAIWPGFLIFLTVIAFNFLGDALQRALRTKSIQIIQ